MAKSNTSATDTTSRLPKRRRGGQELPDNVQDRPEQNAGYDAAVRGGPAGETDDRMVDITEDDERTTEREEDARNDADSPDHARDERVIVSGPLYVTR